MARLSAWSARRPIAAVAIAVLVIVLSAWMLSRTTIAPSLQAMLGNDSPAAAALGRVTTRYRAVDELFVLASLPPSTSRPELQQARLAGYAQRLEGLILDSSEASEMVAGFRFAQDPAYESLAREVILPAGAYYLDDAAFSEFLRRLTPEGMRTQIARNEALAAAPGPAAGAVGEAMLRDPLRLGELIESRFAAAVPLRESGPGASLELSDDGLTLLIRIAGRQPVDDLPFAQSFTDQIGRLAEDANTDGLSVELAGSYAIAAATSRAIRADAIRSSVAAVILLHLLFFAVYRRVGTPLLIGGVAAAGIVWGFGVHAAFAATITPLTAVISAMLAGLGVDYGVHFISHYEDRLADGMDATGAAVATAATLSMPISANCLTSILGFASLWASSVAMLRDFAIMGALGLLGALLFLFFLMPALLVLTDRSGRRRGRRAGLVRLTLAQEARPGLSISASLVIAVAATLAAVGGGLVPEIEADLSVMHPRPNRALELTNTLSERFSSVGESIPVELSGASHEELVTAAHDAARLLTSGAGARVGVSGVLGLNMLLPDPRTAGVRRGALQEVDAEAVLADFDAALSQSIFDPVAFDGYRGLLGNLISVGEVPGVPELLAYPSIAGMVLPRDESSGTDAALSTLLLVRFDHPLNDRHRRDAAVRGVRASLSGMPGAIPTGMSVLAHDLEAATRGDLPRAAAISAGLVIVWLLVALRRPVDVALALIPLAFAAVCTTGFMIAAGERLNAVNGAALPLMNGIAVDAGVFLVVACRGRTAASGSLATGLGVTGHAVLIAAVTTVIGFGSLFFTQTPAIRSLGLVVSIGIGASLIGALFLLAPVLLMRARRENHA